MTQRLIEGLWVTVFVSLVFTGMFPYEHSEWAIEVVPIFIVTPILWFSRKRCPITPLLMVLLALYALLLIIGGVYTYTRVPFGLWLQHLLHLTNNPYDKIDQFMQGIIFTLAARELFIRHRWLVSCTAASVMGGCVAMALSALFELVKWWGTLMVGQREFAYPNSQEGLWDARADMLFTLIGSFVAIFFLSKWQDRQIKQKEWIK